MTDPLLEVTGLKVHFRGRGVRRRRVIRAVDGIDFSVSPGESLALVGESGCGKSSTVRAVLRLIEPTAGRVVFGGAEITNLDRREMRPFRRQMQLVFQNPHGSLNPRMTARQIISQPLRIHGLYEGDGKQRVDELLDLVGLGPEHANRFPHEFSDGQRQRIGIARALALSPKLVLLDEPVSSLDVSIRAQILNLLRDIQANLGVAYLLVSHDLSVVRHFANRVAVMYLGRIVESAERRALFENPSHPYTKALLSAVPIADPSARRVRVLLPGEVGDPANPPPGCRFSPRCFQVADRCRLDEPPLDSVDSNGHLCACFFPLR